MESLYLLIPLGLVLVTGAGLVFVWAVRSGQYDDLDREASRILFSEEPPPAGTDSKPGAGPEPHDD